MTDATPGRFDYRGLERLLHEKARLGIVSSLASHADGLLFADLKQLCGLTDGNLSRHLHVLHEAGVVQIRKGHKEGRSQTLCRLTAEGRRRFVDYVEELERVVRDAAAVSRPARRGKKAADPGWSPA